LAGRLGDPGAERRVRAFHLTDGAPVGRAEQTGTTMSEHTYRMIEVVGSSPTSIDEAIREAIVDASKTIRHIGWFQVVETRGHVEDGKVAHFQVTVKIGFTLDDR